MAYYNTTNETGEVLKTKVKKTESQKSKILNSIKYCTKIYKNYQTTSWTILAVGWCGNKALIGSIRRAVTDLVREGELVYTGEMKMADKGSTEKLVKLNTNK
jgi:hypothetical protein